MSNEMGIFSIEKKNDMEFIWNANLIGHVVRVDIVLPNILESINGKKKFV